MGKNNHILVLRFSALGDIAMTVPVIKNVLEQNPALHITMLSVPFAEPMFANIPRCHFHGTDIRAYKSAGALYMLAKALKKDLTFDAVVDLHNVLRTKLLRFFWFRKPCAVLDKGRKEKRELTRAHQKKKRPVRSMFERYADVFRKLNLPVTLNVSQGLVQPDLKKNPPSKSTLISVGVAPFAKHAAKMYPLEKMLLVCTELLKRDNVQLIFFAAESEYDLIQKYLHTHPHAHFASGKSSFKDELETISQLDVMISMDSANMHLASLYGVPVVSIWGGTHPFSGFYGWGQHESNIVQVDLPCRPSSVFGNKDCPVHGAAGCMQDINSEMIVEKVLHLLKEKL